MKLEELNEKIENKELELNDLQFLYKPNQSIVDELTIKNKESLDDESLDEDVEMKKIIDENQNELLRFVNKLDDVMRGITKIKLQEINDIHKDYRTYLESIKGYFKCYSEIIAEFLVGFEEKYYSNPTRYGKTMKYITNLMLEVSGYIENTRMKMADKKKSITKEQKKQRR